MWYCCPLYKQAKADRGKTFAKGKTLEAVRARKSADYFGRRGMTQPCHCFMGSAWIFRKGKGQSSNRSTSGTGTWLIAKRGFTRRRPSGIPWGFGIRDGGGGGEPGGISPGVFYRWHANGRVPDMGLGLGLVTDALGTEGNSMRLWSKGHRGKGGVEFIEFLWEEGPGACRKMLGRVLSEAGQTLPRIPIAGWRGKWATI